MNEQDSIIATGRQEFDRELGRLETELILMSGFVEKAIFDALQALKNRDIDRSQRVIDEDDHIDETELEIERYCVELIRRQSPMAGDLRRIVASLQIAGELERIGDDRRISMDEDPKMNIIRNFASPQVTHHQMARGRRTQIHDSTIRIKK